MSLLDKESVEYYEKVLRVCGLLCILFAIVSIVLLAVKTSDTLIALSLSISAGFGGVMVFCIALVETIKKLLKEESREGL